MKLGEGETKCYWLEPTGRVRLSLRRFTFSEDEHGARPDKADCPASSSGHDATVVLDVEIPTTMVTDETGWTHMGLVPEEHRPPRDDPRWPQVCEACGEAFPEGASWQVNQWEVFTRGDTGEKVTQRGHFDPTLAGALRDLWWRKSYEKATGTSYTGPDGIALGAVCPNGLLWEVDGPATGGGRWTRTGDPRRPETLSVSPSIIAGDYHGFLGSSSARGPGWFSAHIG